MVTLACPTCHTPMFDEEQIVLVVVWAVANATVLFKVGTAVLTVGPHGDACRACGYSLGGLDEAGVCPECGGEFDRSVPLRRATRDMRFDWTRARRLVLPVVCFAAALLYGRYLLWPALVVGYILDDTRLSIARVAASREIEYGVLYGWLPIPLAMAFTPLTARWASWRWRVLAIGVLLAAVLCWAAIDVPEVAMRW